LVVPSDGHRPAAPVGRSTKEQLVLTAERLFAIHGIASVSLRQIAAESGAANNSAVQYHFGSKDRLIDAILVNRLDGLGHRRDLIAGRTGMRTVRAVVESQLLPVIELGEDPDCYYLLFLEQLQRHGIGNNPFDRLPPQVAASQRKYFERLTALLPHVPAALLAVRTRRSLMICMHICSDRQRARLNGSEVESYGLHVGVLLDEIVGFLGAEPSEETVAALDASTAGTRRTVAVP
jgi:AcrR family transcriptional regulator